MTHSLFFLVLGGMKSVIPTMWPPPAQILLPSGLPPRFPHKQSLRLNLEFVKVPSELMSSIDGRSEREREERAVVVETTP